MPTETEQDLRLRARDALRRQLLPSRKPDHTFGGPGSGAICRVCGNALVQEDMVFDLEFTGSGRLETLNLQLHVRCFAAWELERMSHRDPADLRLGTARATLAESERDLQASGTRE